MRRWLMAGMIAAMLVIPALPAGAATGFADARFQAQWQQGEAVTPNFWGPLATARDGQQEEYREAAGGKRLVQYFDKGRMELTNGAVTNGLLASEIIKGQIQIGDATFQPRPLPSIPIAGDPDNPGPTWAHLATKAQPLCTPTPRQANGYAQALITATGESTVTSAGPTDPAMFTAYDEPTQHNVPRAFVEYRAKAGLPTIGYAICEPFSADVRVAGVQRRLHVQVFERRVLTYNPANPDAFKVEMGNIGQHYYQWRYGGTNVSGGPCTEACVFLGKEGGAGLADVAICLAYRSGEGNPVAKTDATGRYVAKAPGHRETVVYWPVKAGYAFAPAYGAIPPFDAEQPLTANFVGSPASGAPSDCSRSPFA